MARWMGARMSPPACRRKTSFPRCSTKSDSSLATVAAFGKTSRSPLIPNRFGPLPSLPETEAFCFLRHLAHLLSALSNAGLLLGFVEADLLVGSFHFLFFGMRLSSELSQRQMFNSRQKQAERRDRDEGH